MRPFEPIAIVGQGCVLPGALSPAEFFAQLSAGTDLLRPVPEGRWRVDPSTVSCAPGKATDGTWSSMGGYVEGFEGSFTPEGFAVDAARLAGLDPLFHWVLHASRQALESAGVGAPLGGSAAGKAGIVLGNLSFPSELMSAFGEAHVLHHRASPSFGVAAARALGMAHVDPRNRFMSGLPAHLAAEALGLTAGAMCLDAACASSLYAIRIACDWLHDRRADLMLAGAVNRADSLFLHVGFCALSAMSPTGRSRPFHASADGLVPAEGAGIVALMRLDDARRQERPILGVVRGIGLSNDGRARNLLAPSREGQLRAMRAAYEMAALTPQRLSYIECHATGTPTGDGTELESLGALLGPRAPAVAIGSLKSNLGHLITAAGVAGLFKVLGALHHKRLPPTLHVEEAHPLLRAASAPCRVVTRAEEWQHAASSPRLAAVSAFGFGGNNAHLLVEEYRDEVPTWSPPLSPATTPERLAIVGVGARVGTVAREGLLRHVVENEPIPDAEELEFSTAGMRFPPNDLKASLPQQVRIFDAVRDAVSDAGLDVTGPRVGVLVGMGCDVDVTSPGVRWRAPHWARLCNERLALGLDEASQGAWVDSLREAACPAVTAPGVLGQMPNIPANRVNVQYDVGGPGFTLSAEEHSGLAALELASTWLRSRMLDAVIVGAVDVCTDARHVAAAREVARGEVARFGDAAVVLVVKRLDDAERAGDAIYAVIEPQPPTRTDIEPSHLTLSSAGLDDEGREAGALERLTGHTHAASGLLQVAVAALCLDARRQPGWHPVTESPREAPQGATVSVGALGAGRREVVLTSSERGTPPHARPTPHDDNAVPALILRVPARRLPSPLPAPPRESSMPRHRTPASTQVMSPAPALPPVGSAPPTELVAAVTTEARPPLSTHASSPAGRQSPTTLPADLPQAAYDDAWTALVEARAELAHAHEAFLHAQTRAHQLFLSTRSRQMEHLGAVVRGPQAGNTLLPTPTKDVIGLRLVTEPPAPPASERVPSSHASAEMHDDETPSRHLETSAPASPSPRALAEETLPPREASVVVTRTPRGSREHPLFDRIALERLASGRISEVFGPVFSRQDGYPRQVRMPEPPLLLCDRVLDIDAEPGVLEPHKTIWTESDVRWDSWYLHHGRIPPGVLIESGQADLLLISWMGVDFENRGERVYRLLGCDLTYHGELPSAGTTLHYDIHIDGFATHGNTRLFFFHSDARKDGPDGEVVLSVRNGQAGFFSDEELRDSGGCLWQPTDVPLDTLAALPLDDPKCSTKKTSLTRAELEAWAAGDAFACFGEGFERTQTHVRTPCVQSGDMLLLDRVSELQHRGGPWRRGYLRAELDLSPDRWFFDGHFKDDPCMPGTLMFEGCLQAMSVFLAGQGHTLDKDGWRFEPGKAEQFTLRCRGQAIPSSRHLVYEVFVRSLQGGERPRVTADILVTVDGLKGLHCEQVSLELVPDYPLYGDAVLLGAAPKTSGWDAVGGVGRDDEDTVFGQTSLLATGIGKPSDGFGELYADFDFRRRLARLPGPPYHFMSRVRSVEGPPLGGMREGNEAVVEYDVPADAWYFDENGDRTMPFAVLLEIALQPCGWISSYVGSMRSEKDLCYRNLDGRGVVHRTLLPDVGTLSTRARMTSMSMSGGLIIQQFTFAVSDRHGPVFDGETTFGFFPPEALARQVGVGSSDEEKARLGAPCPALPDGTSLPLHFQDRPTRFCGGTARLAGNMLLNVDRLTGVWPDGGSRNLGFARAEKDIDESEWFFKAHFFQDPVQPGSLGVEAMLQTLQAFMLERGLADELVNPVFEPIAPGEELVWRYRGQVVPEREKVIVEVDVLEIKHAEQQVDVVAQAWLWCDGLRIYHAPRLCMRARSTR